MFLMTVSFFVTGHKKRWPRHWIISQSRQVRTGGPAGDPENDLQCWETVGIPCVLLINEAPCWGAPWDPAQGAGGAGDAFLFKDRFRFL